MVTISWFETLHVSPDNSHPVSCLNSVCQSIKECFQTNIHLLNSRKIGDALNTPRLWCLKVLKVQSTRQYCGCRPFIPWVILLYVLYCVSVQKNMFREDESKSIIEFPTETGLLTALTFDISTYHELSSRMWIFSTLDSATIFRKSVYVYTPLSIFCIGIQFWE